MCKILILSTGDVHGAYEAAYKMAKCLHEAGHEVVLLVKNKTKVDDFVIKVHYPVKRKRLVKRLADEIALTVQSKIFKPKKVKEPFIFDPTYLFLSKDEKAECISAKELLSSISFKPELIIAGMTDNFTNTTTLKDLYHLTGAKIYTWMIDMSHITGGCHYAWDCKGWVETSCKNCPAIINESGKILAHENFLIKKKNINEANIKIISMSGWADEQIKTSLLYKHQKIIYNTNSCIDTRLFNDKNRNIAKRVFSIDSNKKIIFTGSWNVNDQRKGLPYFVEALKLLWDSLDNASRELIQIFVVGEYSAKDNVLEQVPFAKHSVTYINDYRLLSLAYQAADIFICASIEDTGPMMVSEALACGTPVVGFDMGVVHNMVVTGYNGYKAKLKDAAGLAEGMQKILFLSEDEFNLYSKNAVTQIAKYSSYKTTVDIIESILQNSI